MLFSTVAILLNILTAVQKSSKFSTSSPHLLVSVFFLSLKTNLVEVQLKKKKNSLLNLLQCCFCCLCSGFLWLGFRILGP